MDRMFDNYIMGIDRNWVKHLNISKQNLITFFVDPRTRTQPPVAKK